MAVLKNARHEAFAQALAKGKTQEEAYQIAGYKPNRSHASRLVSKGNVAARVAELQGRLAKKVEVTLESLYGELEEARALAVKEKQTSAAVSATMGKAKLAGLIVDKHKLSGTLQVITVSAKQLDALTDDELSALEAAYPVLQKLGLIGGDQGATTEEGS